MRLLIISYQNPDLTPGGAQQVAYDEYIAATRAGVEADFLCVLDDHQSDDVGGMLDKIVCCPGKTNQFNILPSRFNFALFASDSGAYLTSIVRFVEQKNPDVIHFHHYHRVGANVIEFLKARFPHIVVCLSFHEMLAICPANGQMRRLNDGAICQDVSGYSCVHCLPRLDVSIFETRRRILLRHFRSVDHFVFPSHFLRDLYCDWGLPEYKCHVVPNGQPDYLSRKRAGVHSAHLNRFGYFGQLIENKGVHHFIEAIGRFDWPFWGVDVEINASESGFPGDGYYARIRELIQEVAGRKESNVRIAFRGSYRRSELRERMSCVDWVVVPSIWPETFALVVSEAWANGRPVLAADLGALSSRVQHGVNGLKYESSSLEGLRQLLEATCGNADLWRQLNLGISEQPSDTDMLNSLIGIWRRLPKSRC